MNRRKRFNASASSGGAGGGAAPSGSHDAGAGPRWIGPAYGRKCRWPWRGDGVSWYARPGPANPLWRELFRWTHAQYDAVATSARLVHLEDPSMPSHYRTIKEQACRAVDPLQETYLQQPWPRLHRYAFPGSVPLSIMRADIPRLYSGERTYVLLLKSDGTRYLIGFTRVQGRAVAFAMDRAGRTWLFDACVPDSFYDGTLLDGELLRSIRTFEIFDALCIAGQPCGHYDYVTRMEIVHRFCRTCAQLGGAQPLPQAESEERGEVLVDAPYSPTRPEMSASMPDPEHGEETVLAPPPPPSPPRDAPPPLPASSSVLLDNDFAEVGLANMATHREPARETQAEAPVFVNMGPRAPFGLVPKRVYKLDDAARVCAALESGEQQHHGIVFMPVEDPVRPGHCPRILKYKRGLDNTIDFWLTGPVSSSGGEAYVTCDCWVDFPERERAAAFSQLATQKPELCDIAGATMLRFASIRVRRDECEKWCNRVVECRWTAARAEGPGWRPIGVRSDKRRPNTFQTAQNTNRNIQEDLQPRDLFPHLIAKEAPGAVPFLLAYEPDATAQINRHVRWLRATSLPR